jgi:hypothetical protein
MVRYVGERSEDVAVPSRQIDDPTVAALLAAHLSMPPRRRWSA